MTGSSPRPNKEEALRPLRSFQRRTVDHVVRRLLAPDGSRRFLVADEVGLGKTLVARGVVAEFVDRHWDQVPQLDIIYLCSNAALARENIHKLRIGGTDCGSVLEATRFTLLPAQKARLHPRLNFISLTPGTAMRTSGGGIQQERLVLHQLLRQSCREGRWLTNFLQGQVGRERWRELVRHEQAIDAETARRFHQALEQRPELNERLLTMEAAFARVDGRAAADAVPNAYRLIGELRNLLARVCIDTVQPDLIILDEFQRFKDLLTTGDSEPSAETELAQQLFSYRTPEGQRVALLLLSATPYRMFTTSEESATEDHHRDFLQTLQFLVDDASHFAEVETTLRAYREALMAAVSGGSRIVASARERLQASLLRVMCRQERVGSTQARDGMVCERRLNAPVEAPDVQQYLALERLRGHLDGRDFMELWKSAPYVLNFAKDYEFKRSFAKNCAEAPLRSAFAPQAPTHLDSSQIAAFAAIEPCNARFRLLAEESLGRDQWRMLWLPPSLPYWPLRGAWAHNAKFTKKLLFSCWNVVPDAISALLSYEVERRCVNAAEGRSPLAYGDLSDKRSQLLRFAAPDGRAASMTTLALQLPCLRLAALHPLSLERGEREDIRAAFRKRIEPLLTSLKSQVTSLGPDPSWYWAALLLLDEDPAATIQFLDKLEQNHLAARKRAADDDTLDEEEDAVRPGAGFQAHVARALALLRGEIQLGDFPDDLLDTLVDFACGSPAIVWARTLAGFRVSDPVRRELAASLAVAFRSLFNQPAVIRMLQSGDTTRYWRSTLHYAADGNLQAVLDEYAHLLWEPQAWSALTPDEIARRVTASAASALTTKTSTVHPDYYAAGSDRIDAAPGAALRTHFALRYGGARSSGGGSENVREDAVRDAFKSPFYPFVLTSTSVGQEGLDFHPWCHSVWHWNLPGNPVDLEQREGRVHRYKGHAVRKNVAERHGAALLEQWVPGTDPWSLLFDLAERSRAPGESELTPCWLAPGPHKVERVVPLLSLSREGAQLQRLERSLAIYRVVFGQPRQAELVELLNGATVTPEELESWVVRLEAR